MATGSGMLVLTNGNTVGEHMSGKVSNEGLHKQVGGLDRFEWAGQGRAH